MTQKTQINLVSFLMETFPNPEEYEKVSLELSRITNGIKTYEDLVRVANLDFDTIKISEESKRLLKEAISKNQLEETKTKTANTNKFMKIYQHQYKMDYYCWNSMMFFQYLISRNVNKKDAFFISTDIDVVHFVNGYSDDEINRFEELMKRNEVKQSDKCSEINMNEINQNEVKENELNDEIKENEIDKNEETNQNEIKEEQNQIKTKEKTIQNEINQNEIKQYTKWKINNQYQQYNEIKQEIKKEYASMIITKATRKIKQSQEREKIMKQRNHVISEIVSTERSYVEHLRTVIEYILKPVKQNKMIKEELIPRLFGDIILIHNVNKQFSQLLDSFKVENYPHLLIGKIFNTMSGLFNIYREYGVNYRETAKEIIKMTKENHPFIDWSKQQITDNAIEANKQLDVSSLLITPVQRLPRYVLLMKEIIKHTPKDHPDYKDATEALNKANEVSMFVNKQTKQAEAREKWEEIKASVINLPDVYQFEKNVTEFVLEGTSLLLKGKKVKSVYIYIFDNTFFLCEHLNKGGLTQKKKSLKYLYHEELKTIQFLAVDEKLIENKEGFQLEKSFSISNKDGERFIFALMSVEQKEKFVDTIMQQKEKIEQMSKEVHSMTSAATMLKAKYARSTLQQKMQLGGTVGRKWSERGESALYLNMAEKCSVAEELISTFSSNTNTD